jgi:tetratricopeptide (TPR) repeat protein
MMKYIILFYIAISISACNQSSIDKEHKNKMDLKILNDSVIELILTFQSNQDSILLNHALVLNNKAMALDSSNSNLLYNLNVRAQILALLNKKKEAFLLKERTLSKDKFNIDRLIYYGQKNRLMGRIDSSEIYFNAALTQCDKLLVDTFNIDAIIKKAEIYMYQKKKKEALRIINQALVKSPKNVILTTFKENLDQYYEMSNIFFDDIKL